MMVKFKKQLSGYYGDVKSGDVRDIRKDVAHELIAQGFAEARVDKEDRASTPDPDIRYDRLTMTPEDTQILDTAEAGDTEGDTGDEPLSRRARRQRRG